MHCSGIVSEFVAESCIQGLEGRMDHGRGQREAGRLASSSPSSSQRCWRSRWCCSVCTVKNTPHHSLTSVTKEQPRRFVFHESHGNYSDLNLIAVKTENRMVGASKPTPSCGTGSGREFRQVFRQNRSRTAPLYMVGKHFFPGFQEAIDLFKFQETHRVMISYTKSFQIFR